MPGKMSTQRKKERFAEITTAACAALRTHSTENPYAPSHPNHARFTRRLAEVTRLDRQFRDLCAVYGTPLEFPAGA